MTNPRLYIDSCCLIEALKGRAGKLLQHPHEADMTERVLRAAREGKIDLFTSTLTVAEVVHVGDKPPTNEQKNMIERLLLSGRDGIVPVAPNPFIVTKARDLVWKEDLHDRAMDRVHVASALHVNATELLTLDGRLAKKFGATQIENCKLIPASDTTALPSEYRENDLFSTDK